MVAKKQEQKVAKVAKKPKKTAKMIVPEIVDVIEPAAAAAPKKKKTIKKKVTVTRKVKKSKKKAEPKVIEVPEIVPSGNIVIDDGSNAELVAPPKLGAVKRGALDRESLASLFDTYLAMLEYERASTRRDKSRRVNVKNWTALINATKKLRTAAVKSVKKPKRQRVATSASKRSGFHKPVQISSEMAQFGGWNEDELVSRVDVTRAVCAYIKEHDLQNPENRRLIKPDPILSELLGYTEDADEPLTYPSIQKKLVQHFPKVAAA